MKSLSIRLLSITLMLIAPPAWAEKVAVSIKPIHSLVAMVMEGIDTPLLILPGTPHGGHMKPSQMRMISRAETIFIIDEAFENMLTKPLVEHPGVVHLADTPGLKIYDMRLILEADHHEIHYGHDDEDEHEGHDHDDHDGHDDHDHDDHDDHHDKKDADDHGHHHAEGRDLHLWLDPENAIVMVGRIRDALKYTYPNHHDRLAANAADAIGRLRRLDGGIAADLAGSQEKEFIVFHDAYQYFERKYDLEMMVSILDHHNALVSPNRLKRLEDEVEHHHIDCIFAEPQFDPKIARMLSEISGANLAVIDPIGADIDPGLDHYPRLLRLIAESIRTCSE